MKIFKWIKVIFTTIGIMIAGMFGGQKNKGVRRFGIPGIAILSVFTNKFEWKHLAFLLFIPVLVMGYGENSVLMSWLHSDILVRIVYGMLVSIPFVFFGLRRWLVAFISLPIAFSISAGSMGQIGGFDILAEDMIRYGTLGILIAFNIFFDKKI